MTAEGRRRRRRWHPRRLLTLLLLVTGIICTYRLVYALYPYPYRAEVAAASSSTGVQPLLLLAVMRTESRFRSGAVSAKGAIGLLQLTPATAAWVARQRGLRTAFGRSDLLDPAYNISAGAWYLGYLLRLFGGRLPPAVAAYNAGPTPVTEWLRGGTWNGTGAEAEAIPFPETRLFVRRVLGAYAVYGRLYPGVGGAVPGAG